MRAYSHNYNFMLPTTIIFVSYTTNIISHISTFRVIYWFFNHMYFTAQNFNLLCSFSAHWVIFIATRRGVIPICYHVVMMIIAGIGAPRRDGARRRRPLSICSMLPVILGSHDRPLMSQDTRMKPSCWCRTF